MNPAKINLRIWMPLLFFVSLTVKGQERLNVCLAGLSHDHVSVALDANQAGRIHIIGIVEPDHQLRNRIQQQYQLPDTLFFADLTSMLKQHKPDVVMVYCATSRHLSVVQACAPLGIAVIVEKPLALNYQEAAQINQLAEKYHTQVFTNYWTNWYPSDRTIYNKVKRENSLGPLTKLVFHDGHQGPKELGVSQEFLRWLTDPQQNGGGAIMDFGCYGANQLTWMMDNALPLAVTAITRHLKPSVYPFVDDDATIIIEYPQVTAILESSWNFPFTLLDMEVYGKNGYLQAVDESHIRAKMGNLNYTEVVPTPNEPAYQNNISYLVSVLKLGFHPPADQASLKNNLIVMQILDAAKLSAREGKRITLVSPEK
jgi:predicted dehydrogenase